MNSARQMLFMLSGAALLTASFAIVPPPALSCGDKENCACGAACPSKAEGAPKGACACADAAKAAEAAPGDAKASCGDHAKAGEAGGCGEHAKAAVGGEAAPADAAHAAAAEQGGCAHAAMANGGEGSKLRAEIDPVTGELTVPAKTGTAGIPPAAASATAPAPQAVQVPHPGGGMMAAVPKDRVGHAVATIDDSGKPQVNCAE